MESLESLKNALMDAEKRLALAFEKHAQAEVALSDANANVRLAKREWDEAERAAERARVELRHAHVAELRKPPAQEEEEPQPGIVV